MAEYVHLRPTGAHIVAPNGLKLWQYDEVAPVLVLDDDVTPTVVVQNDLIRYLFADDPDEWYDVTPFVTAAEITPGPATEGRWQPAPPN